MPKVTITFLGTGPSGRIPKPGCMRPSCIAAKRPGSKSARLQQSLLIRFDDTVILFDISEDVLKEWRYVKNVERIDAAFISHAHADAYGGLMQVKRVLLKLKQSALPIYAEAATWRRARERFGALEHLDRRVMRPGRSIRIGPFAIRSFRVRHAPSTVTHPTVGYDIRIDGRRIVFMSDVKHIPPRSYRGVEKPDLLILDGAVYTLDGQRSAPSHITFAEAQVIIRRIAPKRTYLTQIGTTWPPYEKARRIARRAGIHIPYDGLSIQL